MKTNQPKSRYTKETWLQAKVHSLKPLQWIIIALSIFTVLNFCVFVATVAEEISGYKPGESSILYNLRDQDYYYMRSYLGYYTEAEIEKSETLSECYHLYYYFENSVFYYAYTKLENPEQAALYLAACQESAEGAGSLSYHTADIDCLFDGID